MRNAQQPGYITLNSLISKLKEGQYVIPDFQREFEWQPRDISDLMRSIFLDYYIGSLLLWRGKNKNFEALSCKNVYGYKGDADHREYIVLDGQQRLTAMYYAFIAPSKNLPGRKNSARYSKYRTKSEQLSESLAVAEVELDLRRCGAGGQSHSEKHSSLTAHESL